jgi:hypothetical protein
MALNVDANTNAMGANAMCSNHHSYTNNTILLQKLDYILHIIFALFIYNLMSYLFVVLIGSYRKILIVKLLVNIILIMILIYKIYSLIVDVNTQRHL